MFIAERLVGPTKQLKQIIQIEDNIFIRIPIARSQTNWLFVAENLNYCETNLGNDQIVVTARLRTRDQCIESNATRSPLGHAASNWLSLTAADLYYNPTHRSMLSCG